MLTDHQRATLRYLSPLMEANARMVSEHLGVSRRVADGILVGLHGQGLIRRVPELRAWRLTAAGRDWVRENGA